MAGIDHRGQRARRLVAPLPLGDQPGLQHHLCQLFDKERDPIGGGHQLLDDFHWERRAPSHLPDHLLGLSSGQAAEGEVGAVGVHGPGRAELRAEEEEQEHTGCRELGVEQIEKLQRGRIDPVQVFHRQRGGAAAWRCATGS